MKVNDFRQKKRNRSIKITDVAISKVRYTKFEGFNEEQEEFNIGILAEYERLALEYYKNGHKTNNGTLAMKKILSRAKEYGLQYKKGGHTK